MDALVSSRPRSHEAADFQRHHQMSKSGPLSRGRTLIERRPSAVGHVVHEAGEAEEYVHLSVLSGASLGEIDTDIVPSNKIDIWLRVLVGESSEAILFSVDQAIMPQEKRLVTNLHLHPYEAITVSVSDPAAKVLVHGTFTHRPL